MCATYLYGFAYLLHQGLMSGHIVDRSSLCAKDVFLPVWTLSYFNRIRIKQKFGPEFENGYLC